MLAHTARRPLRHHHIHQLSQRAPAAFAVTLSTLAPNHSPPRAPSTTPRRPTTSANADKIPSQTATFRAAQLQSHFSSSSIPNSPKNTGITAIMAQTMSNAPSVFTPRKVGAPHTLEHRIYIEKDGVPVSPFHDIPLYANEQQTILNMVVEIPRWTNAKQEVRVALMVLAVWWLVFVQAIANGQPSGPLPTERQLITSIYRSPRMRPSTPSSRTPRRASCASSATASPTRATSGTTVPSPRPGRTPTPPTPRPR